MLVVILAPGDLPLDRHSLEADVRRQLIARVEDARAAILIDVHFAFDHRDTRAADAAVHREYRARD